VFGDTELSFFYFLSKKSSGRVIYNYLIIKILAMKNIKFYVIFIVALANILACGKKETTHTESQQATTVSQMALEGSEGTESPETTANPYWAGIWELSDSPDQKMIMGQTTFENGQSTFAAFFEGTTVGHFTEYTVSKNEIHFSVKSKAGNDIEISKFSWKIQSANPAGTQIVALVDGKTQTWNKVEEFQSKFDSKHPIVGTWNLEMETDLTGVVFDVEDYVDDVEKYPKYNQYNGKEGGLFTPQLYIRSEDFFGTTDFSLTNNYDKMFVHRLVVSQDKKGKITSMSLIKYADAVQKIEHSETWFVLAFSEKEMALVSEHNLGIIQFYRK
jgi:hypothetical protein